jgi:hypothetical protein
MMKISIWVGILLFCAGLAHADVSDSGDLLIGGQGVIGGTMTVQGSAFSVGGATFSVSAGTVSVGGLLKPSASGIQWADGSVSTTAAAGGPAAYASTTTQKIGATSITATAAGLCVAGSSITMTTGARRVLLTFTGTADGSTPGAEYVITPMVDGAIPAPYDGDTGAVNFTATSPANYHVNVSFSFLTGPLSPGSHTFCLTGNVGAGTLVFPHNRTDTGATNSWTAKEMP